MMRRRGKRKRRKRAEGVRRGQGEGGGGGVGEVEDHGPYVDTGGTRQQGGPGGGTLTAP